MAVAGGLALFFAHGWHYLLSNQGIYFLHGLKLAYPDYVPMNDWFTYQTSSHHFVFPYLLWFLSKLGPLSVTSIVAQAGMMVVLSFGVMILFRVLFPQRAPMLYLFALSFLVIAKPEDAGLGYLYYWSPYLEPAQVAGPLMLLGFAFIISQRWLSAGLCLGVGGAFHASYMMSGAPLVLAIVLIERLWRDRWAWLRLGLPLIVAWGFVSVVVVCAMISNPPYDPASIDALIHFRSPHHYLLSHFPKRQSFAWAVFFVAGAIAVASMPKSKATRGFRIVWGSGAFISLGTLVFAGPLLYPPLDTPTLWRVAPIPFLLGLMAAGTSWLRLLTDKKSVRRSDMASIVGLGVASWFWFRYGIDYGAAPAWRLAWLVFPPLLLGLTWFTCRLLGKSRRVLATTAVIWLAAICVFSASMFPVRSTLGKQEQGSLFELTTWLESNTSRESLFVVPVNFSMADVRLRGKRAVVVDLKSCPIAVADIEAWYVRIQDVCGVSRGTSPKEMVCRYEWLDLQRALMLRERYKATHIIVENGKHKGRLEGLRLVFKNRDYSVLEIPQD